MHLFFRLEAAVKENDFVYHSLVPEFDKLPEIKGMHIIVLTQHVSSLRRCMRIENNTSFVSYLFYSNVLYLDIALILGKYFHEKRFNSFYKTNIKIDINIFPERKPSLVDPLSSQV